METSKPPKLHSACDECRTRKLKCTGSGSPCPRCTRDSLTCYYSPQKPMGRPRKRARSSTASSSTTRTATPTSLPTFTTAQTYGESIQSVLDSATPQNVFIDEFSWLNAEFPLLASLPPVVPAETCSCVPDMTDALSALKRQLDDGDMEIGVALATSRIAGAALRKSLHCNQCLEEPMASYSSHMLAAALIPMWMLILRKALRRGEVEEGLREEYAEMVALTDRYKDLGPMRFRKRMECEGLFEESDRPLCWRINETVRIASMEIDEVGYR